MKCTKKTLANDVVGIRETYYQNIDESNFNNKSAHKHMKFTKIKSSQSLNFS